MTFRQFMLVTHRWLGLGASIILSITGVTGAVLASPLSDSLLRDAVHALHEHLALGLFGGRFRFVGYWTVVAASAVSLVLLLGGLFLWWERKIVVVRRGTGWRRMLFDLHHCFGVLGFALMFLMAITGVLLAFLPDSHKLLLDLHTARDYSLPVKSLYVAAATAFLVQGITGIVMWWKPGRTIKSGNSRTSRFT